MESIGAFPEGDWESLSKMFSVEDLDFTPHFLGQCSFNPTLEGILNLGQSSFFPDHEANNTTESLFQYLSQENSTHSNSTNSETHESYYFNDNATVSVPNFFMDHHNNTTPDFNHNVAMEDQNMCNNLKRVRDSGAEDHKSNAMESTSPNSNSNSNPKKKPRVSRDAQKSKKKAQNGKSEEEISNTSSCSSEDETSEGKTATIVNLNGKARASRGSATDPQSLYARKRRERINERLRILQNLVPNGTKVDISTMLEEAVHYVKFLQLQIKLLSSDDMWMYAPIAYNGMDIGLNNKISQLV